MIPRRGTPSTGRFDRAVVYFNEGAFFEAHEDWEVLWHDARGDERRWLQGLIQLAAAFVHFDRGAHARGFATLFAQSAEKRAGYAGDAWGLDLERLDEDLEPWTVHAERVAAGADLVDGAPAPPTLHYRPGVEPSPSLPE
jgi:hypothetical protein